MTTITINGETLNLAFNLATEIAYEDLTGKPFDPQEVFPDGEPKSNELIKCALACVIANNPGTPIDSDYILHNATRQECSLLLQAVATEMLSWITIPKMAEAHVPSSTSAPGAEEEDDKKKS